MPVLHLGQNAISRSSAVMHREQEKCAFPSKSKSTYGREPARRTTSLTVFPQFSDCLHLEEVAMAITRNAMRAGGR